MMVVGWRKVAIANLRLPGDWRKTLDDPSIPGRAESMRVVGILHEPIVRESDKKLIIGRRRVAAALHLGEEEILCKLVECTNDEAEVMSLMENAYREHLTSDEVSKVTALLATQIAAMRASGKETYQEPHRKKGKLKLPRTVAREIIAEAHNRTPETQRKAEQRYDKKIQELKATLDHDADLGINAPWADLDDDFKRRTNQVVKATWEIAQLFTRAIQRMTMLAESGLPLHQARFNRLREDAALVSKTVRGLLPSDLCPFCKGVEAIQKNCGGCTGTGYITNNQREGVPKELWETGDAAVVLTEGKFVPFDEFFAPSRKHVHTWRDATASFHHNDAYQDNPANQPTFEDDDHGDWGQ